MDPSKVALEFAQHSHMTDRDFKLWCANFFYAYESNKGRLRKTGGDAIIHPLKVALMARDRRLSIEAICAGVNHDTIEDNVDERFKRKEGPKTTLFKEEYEKQRVYLRKRLGRSFFKSIEYSCSLDMHLTNTLEKNYPGYCLSFFKIPNKQMREDAIMLKAADMIENIVSIGRQDLFLESSDIRGDLFNAYLRAKMYASSKDAMSSIFLNSINALVNVSAKTYNAFEENARLFGLSTAVSSLPTALQSSFTQWMKSQSFSGPKINMRAFKNLCFAIPYKYYVQENNYIGKGVRDYNPLDNVAFFFRRLCLVSQNTEMELRGRIEGIARRPGSEDLDLQLHLIQWQLDYEQYGCKTFERKTVGPIHHTFDISKLTPSTSVVTGFLSEQELEEQYLIFYKIHTIRSHLSTAYHGVIDSYLRALVDKHELAQYEYQLDRQYVHATAFMDTFGLTRFMRNFRIKGFIDS